MADDTEAPVNRGLFYEMLHDLLRLMPGSAEHKAEVAASIGQHQAEHDEAAQLGQDIADTEAAPAPAITPVQEGAQP
jgi:hypothetical protein